jgi:Divergent InlB B-repeat domain
MKKQMLWTPKAYLGLPLIMTLVAGGQAAAQSRNFVEDRRGSVTPVVFQAAGPSAASIQSMVDAFRAAVGEPNGNAPGPLPTGRREINWDGGGGVDITTDAVTPFDVFLNTRGARFIARPPGLSQAPPAGGPQGGLAELFDNDSYGEIFAAFSPLRLFTPVGSNLTLASFFVPGTNGGTPAKVSAFGAVFTDVDRLASTVIEYFAANGRSLFKVVVPASPGDKGLSFFGVVFEYALIAKVLITTGNAAPGPNDDGRRDIVMMDDFIYGEPQPQDGGKAVSSTEETARSSAAAEDESATSAPAESATAAAAASQALTVNNGSGSGNHASGAVVTVTANDPPSGQQFAGWTGDIQILANPTLPTTTATVPSTPVTITPTYLDASATPP